jgi:hypothetical protein
MSNVPALAFRISRDFSYLHCELHHMGLSTRKTKENTVVRVCCAYFKGDVEKALQQEFGHHFVSQNIRIQLPAKASTGISSDSGLPDE